MTPPPSSVNAGTGFGMVVAIEDGFGNVVTTTPAEVVTLTPLTPSSVTSRVTYGGTLTATTSSGVATFSGLTVNRAGSGYSYAVTAPGTTALTTLASTLSGVFTVTGGAATQLQVTTPSSPLPANSKFNLTVTAEDQFGNNSTGYSGTVTVALGNNPGNALLGGTLTAAVNPVTGVATFNGLTLNASGANTTLTVSSGNLTTAVTNPFTVSGAAATQLVVTQQPGGPPSTVAAGSGSANTFTHQRLGRGPGGECRHDLQRPRDAVAGGQPRQLDPGRHARGRGRQRRGDVFRPDAEQAGRRLHVHRDQRHLDPRDDHGPGSPSCPGRWRSSW